MIFLDIEDYIAFGTYLQAAITLCTLILGIWVFFTNKRIQDLANIALENQKQTKELINQTKELITQTNIQKALTVTSRIPYFIYN